MRTRTFVALVLAISGLPSPARTLEQSVPAAAPAPNPGAIVESTPAHQTEPVQWSSGVADILKLSRAKIGEETMVAFIANSGKVYKLNAAEIIELKNQGLSDAVLRAMLEQGQKPAQGVVPVAPAYAAAPPGSPQSGAGYAPAPSAYAVPGGEPAYPYTDSSYAPYYYTSYYPYYGGYYGYYPGIYWGYGWGNCYYGGHRCYPYYGYHGCYYGYRGGSHFHGAPFSGGHQGGSPSGGFHGAPSSGGFHGGGGFAMVSHGGGGMSHGGGGGGHGGGHR